MSREAFEAWISDDGEWPHTCAKNRDGGYLLALSADAWRAWKAAQADAFERAAKVCEARVYAEQVAIAIRVLAKEAIK